MQTAAIVGAGLIGRAWAMVFARAGWCVRLYDSVSSQLDVARERIETGLAEQQRAGLVDDAARAATRVVMLARLDETVRDADWVRRTCPKRSR